MVARVCFRQPACVRSAAPDRRAWPRGVPHGALRECAARSKCRPGHGDQDGVVAPGQAVGPVEVLDMALDSSGAAAAVVAQQRQVAGALLGNQHVAVGQGEEAPRIEEARPSPTVLVKPGTATGSQSLWLNQRPTGNDRPDLRRRQIGRIDVEAVADLLLHHEVLRRIIRQAWRLPMPPRSAARARPRTETIRRSERQGQRGRVSALSRGSVGLHLLRRGWHGQHRIGSSGQAEAGL